MTSDLSRRAETDNAARWAQLVVPRRATEGRGAEARRLATRIVEREAAIVLCCDGVGR